MTALVQRFEEALDAEETYDDTDDLEIKDLARSCVEWANTHAATEDLLGNGVDVRAVYALSTGLLLGALAMRDALAP
jgi:ABC-type sugar transport system substrate-binding protein